MQSLTAWVAELVSGAASVGRESRRGVRLTSVREPPRSHVSPGNLKTGIGLALPVTGDQVAGNAEALLHERCHKRGRTAKRTATEVAA
jgi:hypothetical protein